MFFTQTPLSGEEDISVFKTSTNTSTETLVNDSNSDNNGTSVNHGNAAGSLIFGVADGVGGWNDVGISPSVFARTLTSYVKAMSKFEWKLYHREPIDIKNVVRRAFTLMKLHHQSDEVVGLRAQKKESNEEAIPCCGSSTIAACELQLDTGELTTGVLGDSTYSIFQLTSSSESPGSELESNTADGEMGAGEIVQVKSVFNSTEQQHRFNMPYQLCIPPTQEQIQRQKYRKNQKHMYQNESGDKRVEKESANDIRMARNSDSFGDNEQYIGKTGDGRAANGGERRIEDVVEYYSPKMEAITHQVLEQLDSYTFDHEAKQGLDTPNDMVMNSHELGNNSLVLMATDGLFDNVAVAEIETLMESHMQNMRNIQNMQRLNNGVGGQKALGISDDKLEQMVMQQLTADIVKLAIVNYASKESTTPFSERAKQAGYSYTGGKPDDVTIVLCWLKEAKGDKKDNGDGRGGGKNSIDSDRFNFKAKL
ncbi:Protein phosphatase PTC7-like protein [Zancudomyces culisetae]|nr:Protein phosphatase PTC7-like protein [Zancudomyces culisetae]|eukprot:OMH81863.1 Protein phosphatase PTC7-like protein [Zancudomyces culisetae]